MKRIIEAALQDRPCDLVLKNARIVNVFTDQILEGDIGICGGRIAGIGSMEGKEETDLQGRFVLPGFIDAHLHIESSMVTPQALSPVLLSHGVATAVCDPHEIANACGLPGIRFMLDSAGLSRMDYRFTLPSSVPSCDFEVNGAGTLSARDMEPFSLVLGSVHFIDGWPFDDPAQRGRWEEPGAPDAIWRRYGELWCEAAANRTNPYDAMSHPDLAKKFGFYPTFDLGPFYEAMAEAAMRAGCRFFFGYD